VITINPIEIAKNIYWVGAVDWDVRNFHGYLTQRGASYNAYLIIDEKITLIDTVKHAFYDQMLERISKVIDPSKIDYLISNHSEFDHSGGHSRILEAAKNAAIVTTANGERILKRLYTADWNFKIVKAGDTLNLGKNNLHFIPTPMVHWPDNMVSFLPEQKILFSNDAFGQHIATVERFDDEFDPHILMHEAQKYYANIVFPYSGQVNKALEALAGIELNLIAPSHGLIWRYNIKEILMKYQDWANNKTKESALIVYDTMWGCTAKIANAILNAFESKNIPVKLLNLKANHISDIMTQVLEAKYICVGSSTLNNNMMPEVAGFLTYLKGLTSKNKKGLVFGSYGWSGEAVGQIEEILKQCGYEMLEQIKVNYMPKEEELKGVIDKVALHLEAGV
jgi:flavorubredoxin